MRIGIVARKGAGSAFTLADCHDDRELKGILRIDVALRDLESAGFTDKE